MSTFDPNLEPPGDWQMPVSPPPSGPTDAANIAAIYVWISAGIGLVMSCCCLGLTAGLMLVPPETLLKELPPQMPVDEVRSILPVIAVVSAIIGVGLLLIPSLVLAVLGFKVRSASRGACITAIILIGLQTVMIGLWLVSALMGILTTGMTPGAIIPILLSGGYLGLLIWTLAKLRAVLAVAADQPHQPGPWGR